jgi:hypothetical protein
MSWHCSVDETRRLGVRAPQISAPAGPIWWTRLAPPISYGPEASSPAQFDRSRLPGVRFSAAIHGLDAPRGCFLIRWISLWDAKSPSPCTVHAGVDCSRATDHLCPLTGRRARTSLVNSRPSQSGPPMAIAISAIGIVAAASPQQGRRL